MNELEQIVQQMLDEGQPTENIDAVIAEYQKSNPDSNAGKTEAAAEETATVVAETPVDTDLQSESGSLESPRKSVRGQVRSKEIQKREDLFNKEVEDSQKGFFEATQVDEEKLYNDEQQALINEFKIANEPVVKGTYMGATYEYTPADDYSGEKKAMYENYLQTGNVELTDSYFKEKVYKTKNYKATTYIDNLDTKVKERIQKNIQTDSEFIQNQINFTENQINKANEIRNKAVEKLPISPEEIKEYNAIVKSYPELKQNFDEAMASSKDVNFALDYFKRSYKISDQIGAALATTVLQAGAGVLEFGNMLAYEKDYQSSASKYMNDVLIAHQEDIEKNLEKPVSIEDVAAEGDFFKGGGTFATQMLANQTPYLLALGTGAAAPYVFGAIGTTSRLADFSTEEQTARENIQKLEKKLLEAKDGFDSAAITSEIEKNKEITNKNDGLKLLTSVGHGAAEMIDGYADRLLLGGIKKAWKRIPSDEFNKSWAQAGKSYGAGVLTETGSESLTTIGQNAFDIWFDGQDKSYFEGLPDAAAGGFLMGNGFKAVEFAGLAQNIVANIAADKETKALVNAQLEKLNGFNEIINNTESSEASKKEAKKQKRRTEKELIRLNDVTLARFEKLSFEDQKEVMNLDRRARAVNKRWTNIATDNSLSNKEKDNFKLELEQEFNQLQNGKRAILQKTSPQNLVSSEKVKKGLFTEGDLLREIDDANVSLQKVKKHNKKSKFAKAVVEVSDQSLEDISNFVEEGNTEGTIEIDGTRLNYNQAKAIATQNEGRNGLYDPKSGVVAIMPQRGRAKGKSLGAVVFHEYLHAAFNSLNISKKEFSDIKNDLLGTIDDINLSDKQKNDIKESISLYEQRIGSKVQSGEITQQQADETQGEEIFNIIGDVIAQDVLRGAEKQDFLQKLSIRIRNLLKGKLDPEVIDGLNIDTAQGALDFVTRFQEDIVAGKSITQQNLSGVGSDDAISKGSETEKETKKIRIFDFDDTLAKSNSQVLYTLPDGTTGKLNATEYAKRDQELKDKGATFDFSEFSKVIDGKKGPLFEVAQKINAARGNEDLFVLTARPADAAGPIQEFLKLAGLDFKKENIIGLGDGTAQAKADWVQGKVDEGYNDFYFADDAIKNVNAVKDILSNTDIKSKVQQAKGSEIAQNITFEEGSINNDFQNYTHNGKVNNAPESFQAEAAMAYEPLAQAVVDRISKVGLGVSKDQDQFIIDYLSDNQNKQDIVSDLTFGTERNKASSLLGLAKTYNPSVGSFGGYAKSQLANRAIRVLEERVGKQVTQGAQTIDAPESKEIAASEQQIKITKPVVELLNLEGKISEDLNKLGEMATIKAEKSITGKSISDLKKVNLRNKTFGDIFAKRLFNDVKNALGKNTKTKSDFTNFLNNNYEVLSDVALNYIDFQMGSGPSKLWNIDNPPTQFEFVEYYEGKDVKASTRADRKKSLNNAVARAISNDVRNKMIDDNPSINKDFEKVAGIPLGSEIPLDAQGNPFIKFTSDLPGYTQKGNAPFKNVTAELTKKFGGKIDYAKRGAWKKHFDLAKLLVEDGFPVELIEKATLHRSSGRLYNESEYRVKVNGKSLGLYDAGKKFQGVGKNKKPNENLDPESAELYKAVEAEYTKEFDNFQNFIKSSNKAKTLYGDAEGWTGKDYVNYFGKTSKDILGTLNKVEAFNKSNLAMHRQAWRAIFNAVKNNPETIVLLASLTSTDKGTNNFHRFGAEYIGYSLDLSSGVEWEHALPANTSRLILLHAAQEGVKFEKIYPIVQKNYKLIALAKADDLKLKAAGRQNSMGEDFNLYEDSFVKRYFADAVAIYNGGINPVGIVDFNKQTFADKYNVDANGNSTKTFGSEILSDDFNKMLERVKGVKAEARYSEDRANKLARNKGRFKFFVPYSAEDFVGLIYPTLGRGKEGDRNMQWYKENLLDPYAVAINQFEAAKVKTLKDWRNLKKQIKKSNVPLKKDAVRGFNNEEALRVYLWNQNNVVPETLSKKDTDALVKYVEDNPELVSFANSVLDLLEGQNYPEPGSDWTAGSLTIDLIDNINKSKRSDFLKDWQDNVDVVYSKDNMNKLKALYGERYTEALENILYRMKTGRNRPIGKSRLENQWLNWVNDSVGTVMFFNTRSALLQTISSINFINFSDNNPLMAAKAFANQPQFWKDFSTLMNSDFLKSRRSGLKNDVNADEIANAAASSENKVKAALSSILKAGFLPTQIADSFAISIGGASFYRNRLNKYKKQGLSEKEATEKAMIEFQEIAEESQQSSRPDRVSMQQASSLGRLVLAFANTPMQYTRLTKKAALDLVNGRGDWKTNISKLLYYGAVQNIIFTAIQQALFAMMFDDDELDDEEKQEGYYKIGNSIADTLMRGSGIYGAGAAAVKNIILEIIKQKQSKSPDFTKVGLKALTVSPPIDTKIRKLMQAGRAFTYRQSLRDIESKGISVDNPAALALGQVLSASVNVPADRFILKARNIKGSMDQELQTWQRIALALGYADWQIGADPKSIMQDLKNNNPEEYRRLKRLEKIEKVNKKRKEANKKREERKRQILEEQKQRQSPNKRLENGIAGRANNDGTIEIDPNLSPVERAKTIAHEKQHMKDMKAGKLNYDDNYVYWNGKKYERKNGKIKYKGKWYIEGHPSLPWEKKAYNAEPSTKEIKRKKLYA